MKQNDSTVYKLARNSVLKMKAYTSARSSMKKSDNPQLIWMNANENPYNIYGNVKNDTLDNNINSYPDPNSDLLMNKLAQYYKVSASNICLGRGSDEAIDCLVRVFCQDDVDNIIVCPPTFGMYKVYADIQGIKTISIPLADNLELNYSQIVKQAFENKTKLIFITNPQAPLGHNVSQNKIEEMCSQLVGNSIVVVDEAYIEFSLLETLIRLIDKYDNLVVLRTMSKAWAMAGLRLGMAFANTDMIELLRRIQSPYPLTNYSISVASQALTPWGIAKLEEHVKLINMERIKLYDKLKNFRFISKVYHSDTNFIFCIVNDSKKLFAYCLQNNVVIRNFDNIVSNGVRISIGTTEQNSYLLRVFASFEVL